MYRYEGPPAPLAEDGRVIDTPEVAHARAMHLAAHAEALRRLVQSPTPPEAYKDIRGVGLYQEASYVPSVATRNYLGPLAPLAYDTRVTDTPEVRELINVGFTSGQEMCKLLDEETSLAITWSHFESFEFVLSYSKNFQTFELT